jgi:SAM-dependent methyltransferase
VNADDMVAYALEASPELLPFLPELLADLEELGSDARQIADILRTLELAPTARVVDLGSGKGAVAIEIASALQFRVLGIELFDPFVAHARASAQAAGVSHLCEFRHGDVRTMSQELRPADVAVLAALGDVLGDPADTMRIVRDFVRPDGFVLLADVFLREGGSAGFPGFEHYRSRAETARALTAWGDSLVHEVEGTGNDGTDVDAWAIRQRAMELAKRHPEHGEKFLAFAAHQAAANAYIAENLIDAVWVLRRAAR